MAGLICSPQGPGVLVEKAMQEGSSTPSAKNPTFLEAMRRGQRGPSLS